MMKRALLAVALLWSVCTASQAQDRAACERIVRLVAEAVGAGSIGEIEPFLAPGFIFSGQEGDRARAVMKLLVAQLGERVERIETVRQERTEEGLELVCAFTYAGRLGRKEATFLFDGEGRLKRLELLPIRVRTLGDKGGTFARPAARQLDIPVRRLGNLLTATALLDGRERTFILDDGEPLTLLPDTIRLEEKIPADSILVDGKGVGDVGNLVLRERQLLGGDGVVVVVLVLDEETGEVIHGPDMISKGFVFEQQFSHLLEDAKCLVLDHLETSPRLGIPRLGDRIRSSLRSFFRKVVGRDPVVVPVITEV